MRLLLLALAVLAAEVVSAQTFADSLAASDFTITSGEYADEFAITLDPDRTLSVDLRSEDFDAYLIVISPDGAQVENDDWADDIGHARVELAAPLPGTWRILVTSVAVGETGAYTLVIDAAERGGTPTLSPRPAPPTDPEPDAAPDDPLRGTAAIDPSGGGYGWVMGSAPPDAAEARAAAYRARGFRAAVVPGRAGGRTLHRIVVGQFATRDAAEAARSRLPADAPHDAWILALDN